MIDYHRLTREIKDAMRRFINNDDDASLHTILQLAKERQRVLTHRSFNAQKNIVNKDD